MHKSHFLQNLERKSVSQTTLGFYALLPIVILYFLSIVPPSKIETKIKQLISIPLLISLILVPYFYQDYSGGSFTVLCTTIPCITFQRFLDIFWIHPVIYKRPAFISSKDLNGEFWSCIKIDPTDKGRYKKADDKHAESNEVVKKTHKKYYHLIPPIFLNAVAFEVLSAWVKTFDVDDLLAMQSKQFFTLWFFFFCTMVSILMSALNCFGKILQLAYCLIVDGGYYAPDEWRSMMNNPILCTSFDNLWSERWHQTFRPAWVTVAFKPVYFLIRKVTHQDPRFKAVAYALAAISVFFMSGVTHEYVALCSIGWDFYRKNYIGDQMVFFCVNGILVVLEKLIKSSLPKLGARSLLVRALFNLVVLLVNAWLFQYFINVFADYGLWKLSYLTPIGPIAEGWLKNSGPLVRQYCGSLL